MQTQEILEPKISHDAFSLHLLIPPPKSMIQGSIVKHYRLTERQCDFLIFFLQLILYRQNLNPRCLEFQFASILWPQRNIKHGATIKCIIFFLVLMTPQVLQGCSELGVQVWSGVWRLMQQTLLFACFLKEGFHGSKVKCDLWTLPWQLYIDSLHIRVCSEASPRQDIVLT